MPAGCTAPADGRRGLAGLCTLSARSRCWRACRWTALRTDMPHCCPDRAASPAVCLQVAELATHPCVTDAGPVGHGMAAMHLCTPLLGDTAGVGAVAQLPRCCPGTWCHPAERRPCVTDTRPLAHGKGHRSCRRCCRSRWPLCRWQSGTMMAAGCTCPTPQHRAVSESSPTVAGLLAGGGPVPELPQAGQREQNQQEQHLEPGPHRPPQRPGQAGGQRGAQHQLPGGAPIGRCDVLPSLRVCTESSCAHVGTMQRHEIGLPLVGPRGSCGRCTSSCCWWPSALPLRQQCVALQVCVEQS